jgi:hypothetical protein
MRTCQGKRLRRTLAPTVAGQRVHGGPSRSEGYPFIGRSSMVPLPTGMTDTATVLPLPDIEIGRHHQGALTCALFLSFCSSRQVLLM